METQRQLIENLRKQISLQSKELYTNQRFLEEAEKQLYNMCLESGGHNYQEIDQCYDEHFYKCSKCGHLTSGV